MGRNLEINKNLTKNPFLLLDSGKIKCYNIARTKEAGKNRLFRNSENDFLMIFLSLQVYTGEGGTWVGSFRFDNHDKRQTWESLAYLP